MKQSLEGESTSSLTLGVLHCQGGGQAPVEHKLHQLKNRRDDIYDTGLVTMFTHYKNTMYSLHKRIVILSSENDCVLQFECMRPKFQRLFVL